jgi:hypothetical protein
MNNNMVAMFQQFMSNPARVMQGMGIPQGIQGNPQAVIQHLMDTGRLTQAQFNQAQQMAQNFARMMK